MSPLTELESIHSKNPTKSRNVREADILIVGGGFGGFACFNAIYRKNRIILGTGETVESETVIWAAGISPTDFVQRLAQQLNISLDKLGRVPVDRTLKVMGAESIYAIGDCALTLNDKNLP